MLSVFNSTNSKSESDEKEDIKSEINELNENKNVKKHFNYPKIKKRVYNELKQYPSENKNFMGKRLKNK